MIKKSVVDPQVTYLQLLKWRFVWVRGVYIGAYKFGGNNHAISYSDSAWKVIPFKQKVAYLFN